jgi:predicted phage terminase large subunit-like protein
MFGGAAGGGKSSALLMAALQWITTPGYAALLLRRTYSDLSLPGALMDRAFSWFANTRAKWSNADKCWTFPSGGRLTFGYLESDSDKYRYQSSEFQFIGFDEVSQFEESQYTYLFSRLRRLQGFAVPLRMRCASNPGGPGHGFIKQRFLVEGQQAGRVFIPSRLEDNEHVDREEYRASLMQLDPFTRAQLLEGDWAEYSGGFFRREWFPIVDTAPDIQSKVRAWDLAATEARPGKDPDWSAGVLLGRTPDKQYVVLDVVRTRATPLAVQQLVRKCAERDGKAVHVYMEEEAGSSGKIAIDHYRRNVLSGWPFYGVRSTGAKTERAAPFSSMAEAGHVKLVRAPWNTAFLDELAGFPQAAHDDMVDAASLAFAQLASKQQYWLHVCSDPYADRHRTPGTIKVTHPDGRVEEVPYDPHQHIPLHSGAPLWKPFGRRLW